MKNKILLLAACTAFVMTGSVKAQITVNSSLVEISKPLFVSNIGTSGSLKLDLGKCNLTFSNWMSAPIFNPLSTTGDDQLVVGINPGLYDRGAISPSVNNFMDLGTASNRFKTVYAVNPNFLNGSTQLSDIRYKENIKNLQGATATLLKLRPVSFDFKANNDIFDTADLKGKVGFIAQEVQAILPNQVKYLSESDMYTLDYVSMIPYLVKAFQETYAENESLREEVEELREAVELLKEQLSTPQNTPKNKASRPGKSEKEAGIEATLYQNMPNPFSEQTTISYELPERVSSAKILIHSLDGLLIKTYSLSTAAGLGYISVDAGMLSPGIYTYSLSVNNRMVVTKRMVVTE